MCESKELHDFWVLIKGKCDCDTEKGMPSYTGGPAPNLAQGRAEQGQTAANPMGQAQNPIQGGQVYGEQDDMRQFMATQSQGHALPGSLFPAIGLGGQTPTGQPLVIGEESGPANPTFPPTWQEQAESDIGTRLAEMDEVIRAVESLYDESPGLISRLEEEAGFNYQRTKEMLHEMEEEQDRISEIIRQNGKLGKYQRKLMQLREKIPKTVRKLEALGALPIQKPEQSGPMGTQPSGSWREDGETMPLHPQTGEGSVLQPEPQSSAGIAARDQRANMRAPTKEARLNFEAGVRAAAKGLILELVATDILKVPEPVKKARISKGITGQLPPVSEFTQISSDTDHSTTFRVTKHKHFHTKGTVRCECGYPENQTYHLGLESSASSLGF